MKTTVLMKAISLLVLSVFVFGNAVSCGGGGGGTATPVASSSQASSSASAAQGAVALTAAVGDAAGIAEGAVPPEGSSAPGKTGTGPSTDDIAKIDPRLQDVVDKMVGQLRKPAVQRTVAKAGGSSKLMAAGAPPCALGGSYTISDTVTTGTGTTHVLTVSFTNCRDSAINDSVVTYYDLAGSLTGTYQLNNDSSRAAALSVNLTTVEFSDALFTTSTGTLVLDGDFTSAVNGTGTNGTNTANGSFTVITGPANGNATLAFTFTNVNDVWTRALNTPGTGDVTEQHSGNGQYLLSITNNATLEQITLTVTLTDLVHKLTVNGSFADEWVNGRIGIQWSENLASWCVSGNYDFITEDSTPVRTFHGSPCPASGKVQINNATIEYGKPFFPLVTFTINGISQVFANCHALGGGSCS